MKLKNVLIVVQDIASRTKATVHTTRGGAPRDTSSAFCHSGRWKRMPFLGAPDREDNSLRAGCSEYRLDSVQPSSARESPPHNQKQGSLSQGQTFR